MSTLPALQTSDFKAFFNSLHGYEPFPWQSRLLDGLVSGKWDSRQGDANDGESNPQNWPAAMALPTASGKTACIDIALFHLALQADAPSAQRTAPRRIFFCVDRRVIVDEAHERARAIAKRLREAGRNASDDVLGRVAARLCHLAGDDAAPLAVFQLRGGMFRDDAWAASPLQPTVICTTVDQLGSRLLFRGYGVSPHSASIHAGMAANDALILLDEAHCAEPFRQTLDAVRLFRGEKWCDASHVIKTPFAFVEMSATPKVDTHGDGVRSMDQSAAFVLEEKRDWLDPQRQHASSADHDAKLELGRRLGARKLASLRPTSHATATPEFAKELADQVASLLNVDDLEKRPKRIAVMVNRVPTAQAVYDALDKRRRLPDAMSGAPDGLGAVKKAEPEPLDCDLVLMIGRMRPLDRDDLLRQWQPKLKATPGTESREAHDKPIVVVATQCLEVGANLDFDALITEAASLDALRQRFGRLNRLGRDPRCSAVIIAPKDAIAKDADDPIYGPAIANCWIWMHKNGAQPAAVGVSQTAATATTGAAKPRKTSKKNAAAAATTRTIDLGIAAMGKIITADPPGRECFAPAPDAPVMLPAHLDLWCQTAPIPDPDPDVSIFLHGPPRGVPTVSVCWRADLGDDSEQWAEIVSLLPPSSPECMPAPLHLVRKWMRNASSAAVDDTGDVEEAAISAEGDESREESVLARHVLRWRGTPRDDHSETRATNEPNGVRPGDVIVIPAARAHTCSFGHLPEIPSEWTREKNENNENEKLHQLLPDCLAAPLDRAEQANLIARRRGVLRLHADLLQSSPPSPAGGDGAPAANDWIAAVRDALACWNPDELPDDFYPSLKESLTKATQPSPGAEALDPAAARARIAHELSELSVSKLQRAATPHPAGGIVLSLPGRITLDLPEEAEEGSATDESDESNINRGAAITLNQHTRSVADRAARFASCLPDIGSVPAALANAARLHDLGKRDPRWQGMIRGGHPPARVANLPPLAKSDSPLRTWAEQRTAARRAGLPPGFRHEMLSMQIAEHVKCNDGHSLLDGPHDELRDLVLHLIASHHGHARPLAPVVIDENPQPLPGFEFETDGNGDGRLAFPATDASRRAAWEQLPAHRLDSGVCDRFWALTRRYGWWGLAYLEAILRLADRAVSREEQENAGQQPRVAPASRPRPLVSGGLGQ